ncbi:protein of unknown function [Methylocaldum szegediense]|uniref:Uncharacterized protein n=1 Tax=Methylocaldum szegediense TaxID=73780 RepID=A0ABM9I364_9GAMM|nr:protein of unknown function [Methylocaldum szegediense]
MSPRGNGFVLSDYLIGSEWPCYRTFFLIPRERHSKMSVDGIEAPILGPLSDGNFSA